MTFEHELCKIELCEICGKEIKTMTFKGTGVCGEEHFKERERGQSS